MVPATLSNAAVLVVDDEADTRHTLMELLKSIGCSPLEAGSGPEALKLLESGARVDVMVADVIMPGIDGMELARRARKLRPSLPAIMMTGNADAVEAVTADGTFALIKPYSLETLKNVVAEALESRSSE